MAKCSLIPPGFFAIDSDFTVFSGHRAGASALRSDTPKHRARDLRASVDVTDARYAHPLGTLRANCMHLLPRRSTSPSDTTPRVLNQLAAEMEQRIRFGVRGHALAAVTDLLGGSGRRSWPGRCGWKRSSCIRWPGLAPAQFARGSWPTMNPGRFSHNYASNQGQAARQPVTPRTLQCRRPRRETWP